MPLHYRKSPTEEADIQYNMHEDGFIDQTQNMVSGMVDTVRQKLPQGLGVAGGAGAYILAIGAGLAVGEAVAVGMLGYCLYKKLAKGALLPASTRDILREQIEGDIN